MSDEPIRILIVEARFYDDLADALLEGATQALTAFGAEHDVVSVPGALEIPGAIAFAEEGGHGPMGKHYDGYVALGAVIRGETYHFEIVSNGIATAGLGVAKDGAAGDSWMGLRACGAPKVGDRKSTRLNSSHG